MTWKLWWHRKETRYGLWLATLGRGYDINDTRTLCPPAIGQRLDLGVFGTSTDLARVMSCYV